MLFDAMPNSLIASSAIYFGLAYNLKRNKKDLGYYSQGLFYFMSFYYYLSLLFGLGFLIYYGKQFSWYMPFVLFIVSGIIGTVGFVFLEGTLGELKISIIGIVGLPISGYYMITTMPLI